MCNICVCVCEWGYTCIEWCVHVYDTLASVEKYKQDVALFHIEWDPCNKRKNYKYKTHAVIGYVVKMVGWQGKYHFKLLIMDGVQIKAVIQYRNAIGVMPVGRTTGFCCIWGTPPFMDYRNRCDRDRLIVLLQCFLAPNIVLDVTKGCLYCFSLSMCKSIWFKLEYALAPKETTSFHYKSMCYQYMCVHRGSY